MREHRPREPVDGAGPRARGRAGARRRARGRAGARVAQRTQKLARAQVEVVTRLADAGRAALDDRRPSDAAVALREADQLWRGPAYAGFEDTSFGRTERQRLAVAYHHLGGLPYAEVAAELGVPVGTLRSRVFYGLKALRLALEEMGVEP